MGWLFEDKAYFEGFILSQTANFPQLVEKSGIVTQKTDRIGPKVRFMHLYVFVEHITFDFLLGFLLAVAMMVVLWVPLFFFDYKAEKKRGAAPVGSGENPPTPPLDKVHLE